VFSDTAPIVVTGNPPAPPPPPPPKPPEPPPQPAAPKLVEVTKDQIVIHDKIQFETDKAAIKPESNALLTEITKVVQENVQIKRISIEGHTDSTGGDKHNKTLSEQRAASVRDYLVQHGVAAERLSSRGFGKTKPIGDNDTAAGREANRRVEFVIVEQTPATEMVPEGATGAQAAGKPATAPAPEGAR
jgi:OOP family OmpA-OmpF porin